MPIEGLRFNVGDRVSLRDRAWQVRAAAEIPSGFVLDVEALDGGKPARIAVAVPPDRPELLPNAGLVLAASAMEALAPWVYAHRALLVSRVRDRTVCSGALHGRVALESYQLAPALRLLGKPRPSLLVADDVGLGKTIEAGLALLELSARGMAGRALVVVPPGLLLQWQEELRERFGERFIVIESAAGLAREQARLPAGVSPWDALPRVLTSLDYLKKETVRSRALRKRWDLVIVDEAHSLAASGTPRNPYSTQRSRLGRALRDNSRGLILLTATPHNGWRHSFRSLIELVEPSAASLHGDEANLTRRVRAAMIRRMKAQIARRDPKGNLEPVFLRRRVAGLPVRPSEKEKELLRKVGSYCSKAVKGALKTEQEDLVSFAMQIVKKRALSSRRALEATIENRLRALRGEAEEPPTPAELREFSAEVAQDEARAERTAELILRSSVPKEEKQRKAEVSALNGIRKLLKSLPAADPKISALLQEMRSVLAQEPDEKFIVFTEYRDTLRAVEEALSREKDFSGRSVSMTGGMTARSRLAVQERFESGAVSVLLATDAASEGLNLQRQCRRVVHIELPWNPNRMEQRNGRVDRYGQARAPEIRYLFYPDSPEDGVLDQLVAKIERMQQDEVSTPDLLGVLSGAEDLGRRMALLDPEDAQSARDGESLVKTFEDRTRDFAKDISPLLSAASSEPAERLAGLSVESKTLLGDDGDLEPVALGLLGPSAHKADKDDVYRIEVPARYRGPGVEPVYARATFKRSLAVAEPSEKLGFITPSHPLARALAFEARKKLLHAWEGDRALPSRRLAARRVPSSEAASIVFTFLGEMQSGPRLLEERILAVRVAPDSKLIAEKDALRWLEAPSKAGEVPHALLEKLFGTAFTDMQAAAAREVAHRISDAARELSDKLQGLGRTLREHVDTDLADRMAEIAEEEKAYLGMIEEGGQERLFPEEERKSGGFDARRAAAKTWAAERLKEIAEFEAVDTPSSPRPLGALLLVPEGAK